MFLLVFLSGLCVVLVLLSEQKIEVSSSSLKMEAEAQKPNERDLLCGWRSYRPKFLQKLNTPKWFLVFLTIYSFMQGELPTCCDCVQVMLASGVLLLSVNSGLPQSFEVSSLPLRGREPLRSVRCDWSIKGKVWECTFGFEVGISDML